MNKKQKAGELDIASLRAIYRDTRPSALVWDGKQVARGAAIVDAIVAGEHSVYGINTGFGANLNTKIAPEELAALQERLVLSHCAGVGPDLPEAVVRLIMTLKLNTWAQGYSGVRPQLCETLSRLLTARAYPCIPAHGSVGASGDLAPLAHLGAAMMGVGEMQWEGRRRPAAEVLQALELEPVRWGPKEGLSCVNGTQVSTAIALAGLFETEHLFNTAVVAGALSMEALYANLSAFDERLHHARRQPGQIRLAAHYRRLLQGGERRGNLGRQRLQDPYSVRCQPQVMGACWDQASAAARVLVDEANGVSDNPMVTGTPEAYATLMGGNFHAEPVAFAADNLALVLAEVGSLTERRIALLNDTHLSRLPPFLANTPGLDSGMMIPHVTASALVSENKRLATPASVDSIPTSANQEDHVSMATHGALRLLTMAEHLRQIVAIELLAACQGIDLGDGEKVSPVLLPLYSAIRSRVSFMRKDRYVAHDMRLLAEMVGNGTLLDLLEPPLELLSGMAP